MVIDRINDDINSRHGLEYETTRIRGKKMETLKTKKGFLKDRIRNPKKMIG